MKYFRLFNNYIGIVLHWFFRPGLMNFFFKGLNAIYSGWIVKSFKSYKNIPKITYPIYLMGGKYITVGNNLVTSSGVRLEAYDYFADEHFVPDFNIGNDVIINNDSHIGCINKVQIGNGVLIASKVYITDHFHGDTHGGDMDKVPVYRKLTSKGPVIIEDNVWIGDNVVILPNVTIGKNCIIGANSVVNKSFPANSVIAGVPGKLIKILEGR